MKLLANAIGDGGNPRSMRVGISLKFVRGRSQLQVSLTDYAMFVTITFYCGHLVFFPGFERVCQSANGLFA
jgi:hypothetical protein